LEIYTCRPPHVYPLPCIPFRCVGLGYIGERIGTAGGHGCASSHTLQRLQIVVTVTVDQLVIGIDADDGFLHRDIFRVAPNQNPLMMRLNNIPEFDEWRTDFSGRREQARGELVQMERGNVILAASDVAP